MAAIVRAKFREDVAPEPLEPPIPFRAAQRARVLALAYAIEAAVEDGRYRSVAEVARALGVSRARLSVVMRRRLATVAEQEGWLAR